MTEKQSKEIQVAQAKLLDEAMKQPGVAVAAETYGRVAPYSVITPQTLMSTGYAVGGNS
jgi:hypothetical protein